MGMLRHCLAEIRRREPGWSMADEVLLQLPKPTARQASRWNLQNRGVPGAPASTRMAGPRGEAIALERSA